MTIRCRLFGHDWWPDPAGAYDADTDDVSLVCARCGEAVVADDPFPYLRGER
jgi:hypothetical protein